MVKVTAAAALIVSCAALALVAIRPSARPLPPPPPAPMVDAAGFGVDAEELEWRLRAMEDNLSHLGRRLTQLERAQRDGSGVQPSSGGVAAVTAGGVDVASELQSLRQDLHAVATTEALSSDRGREVLKTALRDLQGELQAERVREFRERQTQQREAQVSRFVQEARLTGTQERDVRALLDAEAARQTELTERMRQGERDRSLFTELRALREQNDAQARQVLSADQYEAWSQLRASERGPGRGGGGGGRPGGGRRAEPR